MFLWRYFHDFVEYNISISLNYLITIKCFKLFTIVDSSLVYNWPRYEVVNMLYIQLFMLSNCWCLCLVTWKHWNGEAVLLLLLGSLLVAEAFCWLVLVRLYIQPDGWHMESLASRLSSLRSDSFYFVRFTFLCRNFFINSTLN